MLDELDLLLGNGARIVRAYLKVLAKRDIRLDPASSSAL